MKRIVESGSALRASVERRCAPQWKEAPFGHSLRSSQFPLTTYHSPLTSKGFTLVEMIMVIVITGIIGGIVAVFLKAPIQQYADVARRADMTDIADTALRRMSRDLRLALPNSVRVSGACDGVGSCNLEFIPTHGGGRYRAGVGGGAGCAASPGGEELDFTVADTCFGVLGTMPAMSAGDEIVVYNLGIAGADAYAGNTLASHNRRAASAAGNIVTLTSVNALPFDSPGHRFHVVTTPVTYVCTPNALNPALGTLTRLSGYGWAAPAGAGDLLAKGVGRCLFSYDPLVVGRSGVVTMQLAITEQGETVSLFSASHVSNQP
ncbi:MAG TPA: prepilin-type N-terminal cleavage/methylation domain-containing protein [Gallionella sp.]|nr:prepilin-type N-terminal cleavage/methylation domain-containing protein [Gallionella sp.]